jgi:hypothetical protein
MSLEPDEDEALNADTFGDMDSMGDLAYDWDNNYGKSVGVCCVVTMFPVCCAVLLRGVVLLDSMCDLAYDCHITYLGRKPILQ